MRRFLTSALLAAVWVVVPAGSALAVPPSVVIDHVATGYSVQTIDLCGPIDFFQEIVQVQAGGSFAVVAGSQVDMTVTFDQGLEVLPGGNPFTSQVRATLRTSGTISGGFEAFSGVQVEMMGVNVAPGPLAGSGS